MSSPTEKSPSDETLGVKTASVIPQNCTVGPYRGHLQIGVDTTDHRITTCYLQVKCDGCRITVQDVLESGPDSVWRVLPQAQDRSEQQRDAVTSWMLKVRPARDRHEQNFEAFTDAHGRIFFRAIRAINPDEELFVWYGDEYGMMSGIPVITPANITVNKLYMCTKCWATYEYPNPLKAHARFRCTLSRQDDNERVKSAPEPFRLPLMSKGQLPNDLEYRGSEYYTEYPRVQHRANESSHPEYLEKNYNVSKPKSFRETRGKSNYDVTVQSSRSSNSPRGYMAPLQIDINDSGNSHTGLMRPIQIFNHVHPSMVPVDVRPWHYYYPPYSYGRYPRVERNVFSCQDSRMTPARNTYCDDSTASAFIDDLDIVGHSDESSDDDRSTGSLCVEREEYRYRMPSETDGEPLDLLPRHLYMSKSRNGHLCIYCGKVYSRKYGLKIHLRTHTGYKPLKCKFCLRPFGDPSNLNKHIRLHAEGDTPYKCHICEKVLVRRRDLVRHVKSRHSNEISLELEKDIDDKKSLVFKDETMEQDNNHIIVDEAIDNLK